MARSAQRASRGAPHPPQLPRAAESPPVAKVEQKASAGSSPPRPSAIGVPGAHTGIQRAPSTLPSDTVFSTAIRCAWRGSAGYPMSAQVPWLSQSGQEPARGFRGLYHHLLIAAGRSSRPLQRSRSSLPRGRRSSTVPPRQPVMAKTLFQQHRRRLHMDITRSSTQKSD